MHHWWVERQQELRALAQAQAPLLVYNEEILNEAFFDLLALGSVDKVFQPLEAALHPGVLQRALELGAGFQCTTLAELDRLLRLFHDLDPRRVLFVPARETREACECALNLGMQVVAGTEAWMSWPDILERGSVLRRVRIRSDTLTLEEPAPALSSNAAGIYLEVRGSRKPPVDLTGLIPALREQSGFLPDSHVLCLGGGAGLPVHPEKDTIVTPVLSDRLDDIRERHAGLRIWVEPGRHLLSHAGVLLVVVTPNRGNDRMNGVRPDLAGRTIGRCPAEGALPAAHKPTGPDQELRVRGAMGEDSLEAIRDPDPPAFFEAGDVLVVTNQGCAKADGPLGPFEKHFLKARRICRVKL